MFSGDDCAYENKYTAGLSDFNYKDYVNMGYIIRNGNDPLAQQAFGTQYQTQVYPSPTNPSTNPTNPTDLTNLLSVGIVMGIPPGAYSNDTTSGTPVTTSSLVSFTDSMTTGIGITNSYSTANNSNAGLTIPSKYGSVGGTYAIATTNSSSQTLGISTTAANMSQTQNTNTLLIYGVALNQNQNQVWFLGSNQSLYGIHYADVQTPYGIASFPVVTATKVAPYNGEASYNNLPTLLQGFNPPDNNITSEDAWNNYYNAISELRNWTQSGGVTIVATSSGAVYQQPQPGNTTNCTISPTYSSSTNISKETATTAGWNINIGTALSFGNNTTTSFTTTSTNSTAQQLQYQFTYGAPNAGVNFPDNNQPVIQLGAIYVNIAKCKMQVLNNGQNINTSKPWFIPTYMWNNNKNFWLLGYYLNNSYPN